jgi:hypothetical protein
MVRIAAFAVADFRDLSAIEGRFDGLFSWALAGYTLAG